jgi:hypothetical protein
VEPLLGGIAGSADGRLVFESLLAHLESAAV